MPEYQTYALRSPDVPTFIADLKLALSNAGINPYDKDLLREDENGEDQIGQFLDVIQPGRWYVTKPTYNEDGTIRDSGEKGGYALINAITKDPELIGFIEGFAASDASKHLSEIPDSETVGGGTHRIDTSTIDSPVRVFA